jgi:hypothetical protein
MDYPLWGPISTAAASMILAGVLRRSERELSYILTGTGAMLGWLALGHVFVDRSTVVASVAIASLAVSLWSVSWAYRFRRRETQ